MLRESDLKPSLCAAGDDDDEGAEEISMDEEVVEARGGGGGGGGGGGEGDCELCCWLLDLLVRLVISHSFSGASFLKLACLNCQTVLFSADSS